MTNSKCPPEKTQDSLPPGVKRQRKSGRDYYYHRKTWTRLPGAPWSPEMMAVLKAVEAKAPPAPDMPNTAAAVCFSYLASPPFLDDLAPASQEVRRRFVEGFARDYGHCSMAEHELTTDVVEGIMEGLRHVPGWGRVYLAGLRALCLHAIKPLRLRKTDPTKGIARPKLKNEDGIASWTEEDIAAFRARWPLGTMERPALELLLCTCQRRGDVIRMCRAHVRQGELHVKQSKTGVSLVLPIVPELQAALDAMPESSNPFDPYLMRDGRPFGPLEFTCWFIRACRKAGLAPGKTPHGLRKAACRRLAEAGCTANEIAAISGHKDWREIVRYTRAASQRGMARKGMSRVADAFSGGPENTAETFFGNRGGNPGGKWSQKP